MSTPDNNIPPASQPPEDKADRSDGNELVEAERDALTGKDPAADALAEELDAHERYRLTIQRFEADINKLNAQVEALVIANQQSKQAAIQGAETHYLRKEYLPKLFRLIVWWLVIVVLFVLASSLRLISLSDSVLIAFITSTTVSVLGLFMLAGRWLFPINQKDNTNEKSPAA